MKNFEQQIDRLPLTNDYVFKRVFGKKGNENILKDLLEAILDIKIEKVEVQNPEIPKEAIEDKLSVLDIKAELNKNTIVDIEMQVVDEKNIEERSVVYLSKNTSGQLQTGEQYINLKKSIVINLLNFNHYKRNSYHHVAKMKFDKSRPSENITTAVYGVSFPTSSAPEASAAAMDFETKHTARYRVDHTRRGKQCRHFNLTP